MPHEEESNSYEFQLCDDLSCNGYDATGVYYVSLDDFRSIFTFQTTEISGGVLSSSSIYDPSANINYYVNSYLLPEINPAHTMMDASGSEGIIVTSHNPYSNLLKHDYIFYMVQQKYGNTNITGFINNKNVLKNSLEELGWDFKTNFENIFFYSENNGNGFTNADIDDDNIGKRLFEQIEYFASDRLYTDTSGNNRIRDVSSVQSFPFIENDSINFFWTLNNNDENINTRKYRIKLILTNNTNLVNRLPTDSLADQYHETIYSYGVPQSYSEYEHGN